MSCSAFHHQAPLALATPAGGTDDLTWVFTPFIEISTFDKARVTWDLLSTTGEMEVRAHVIYSNDGVTVASSAHIGAADITTGLKVRDLVAPDTSYKYAMYGLNVRRSTSATKTVEAGTAWATLELR